MKIPFLSFAAINRQIKPEITRAFETVFDEGWYVMGRHVTAFEQAYAAYNEVGYALGTSNGLDALHIALRTLGIGAGDEVLVPAHTFIASALAVSYTGAKPVFAEVDAQTYTLDVAAAAAAVTSRTKAIMPVHLYGQACNMDAVMALADKHGLYVIEDNAQAHGARWNGGLTGSRGHLNATSFYPGKNLGALGDAGAITGNDAVLIARAAMLRNYGSEKKYQHEVIGYNQRLDELQAAFLQIKLGYLPEWTRQRQAIAAVYTEALAGTGDLVLPYTDPSATHVYHLYVIRTEKRDALQAYLQERGIGTLIHYPVPVHLQPAYREAGLGKGAFPVTETIASTCLSLPIWPGMTSDEVHYVATTIRSFY